MWLGLFAALTLVRAEAPSIAEAVRAEMAAQRASGAAVAVIRGDEVLLAEGFGFADLEHQVPVKRETVFQSGSVGKMFTAAAVLLLAEAGALELDDTVVHVLPEADPTAWREVTWRSLLNHTAGLEGDFLSIEEYGLEMDESSIVARIVEANPSPRVGDQWRYSNAGYALVGILVERVSGKKYWEILYEQVFKPAGMATAQVNRIHEVVPNRARGYDWGPAGIQRDRYVGETLSTTGDGSLLISLNDMIAWDAALRAGKLFSEATYAAMWEEGRLRSGEGTGYALGWSIESGEHPFRGHGGAWQGFTSFYAWFHEDDLSVIVLTNSSAVNPSRIARVAAGAVVPALGPRPETPIDDTMRELTDALKRFENQLRAGTLDRTNIAPELSALLDEATVGSIQGLLVSLGAVEEFAVLEQGEQNGLRVGRYRLVFPTTTVAITFGIDTEGRVAVFGLTPGED